jgi:hypothetical protein
MRRIDHNNLASELRERSNFDPKYGTLSELAAYWKNSKSETLLISGEVFEECDTKECLRLKNMLDRGGEEFRIILILRDLLDLMVSSYAQKIKFGRNSYDFDTFFAERIEHRRINYARTAKLWADAFGWQNLRIRLLDRRFLINGDLLDDFLTTLGLDLDSDDVRGLTRSEPVNVSPGWRVVEAVRALHLGAPRLPKDHALADCRNLSVNERRVLGANALDLGAEFGWNKDKGDYLTLRQAEICFATYRAAVRKLNRNLADPLPFPASLDERGFVARDQMPGVGAIAPEELRAFYDKLGSLPLAWREGIF